MLAAIISLVNVMLCNRYVEETNLLAGIPSEASATTSIGHHHMTMNVSSLCYLLQQQVSSSLNNISKHMANKALRQLTIPYMVSNFAFGYLFIWYIYQDYSFHSSPFEIGLYLAFNGILSVLVQGVLINYMIPAMMSESGASLYGLLLHALSTVLIGYSNSITMLYIVTLVFAIQYVHVAALKATIVQESLHDKESEKLQGNLQGVLSSLYTLSNALSSLFFSFVFSFSIHNGWMVIPSLMFIVSALLYLVSAYGIYKATSTCETNSYSSPLTKSSAQR